MQKQYNISIKDRGLRFGDGVFDTIAVFGGVIFQEEFHRQRLAASLNAIKILNNKLNIENIFNDIKKALKTDKIHNGFARIMITRGEGSHGYKPTYKSPPTIIIETMPRREELTLELLRQKSWNLGISSYRKIPQNCLPVQYKLLNSLSSSLTKIEAEERGFDDMILLKHDEQENILQSFISETSSANIFFIKGNSIITPCPNCDILLGSTRELIINICQENNITLQEQAITLQQALSYNFAFITNCNIGLRKINKIATTQQNHNFDDNNNIFSKLCQEYLRKVTYYLT